MLKKLKDIVTFKNWRLEKTYQRWLDHQCQMMAYTMMRDDLRLRQEENRLERQVRKRKSQKQYLV
jgi:hypothetical protein